MSDGTTQEAKTLAEIERRVARLKVGQDQPANIRAAWLMLRWFELDELLVDGQADMADRVEDKYLLPAELYRVFHGMPQDMELWVPCVEQWWLKGFDEFYDAAMDVVEKHLAGALSEKMRAGLEALRREAEGL